VDNTFDPEQKSTVDFSFVKYDYKIKGEKI